MATIKYSLNSKSKWIFFYKILLQIAMIFFAVIFVSLKFVKLKNENSSQFFIIVFCWFFIFNILPLVILYLNHMKYSRNVSFTINKLNKSFFYVSREKEMNFNECNIKKVTIYLSPPAYDKRFDILFFGKYHHAVIDLKNNESLKISCLTCPEIHILFPNSLIIRKKHFFPIIM